MITDPEKLRVIADRNRRIVKIANGNPNLRIRDIADLNDCSWCTVAIVLQRNNISRKLGRPRKVVSRG